jgi:DNA-binding response OmpR family regulator
LSIARLIYDILTEVGYAIVGPAATTRIAAELVAKRRVDAALLDVGLADGPSFSLAESLAARGIPFAFTTACGPDEIPLHLRDRPIIGKPMNIDSLLNVTRELCGPVWKSARPWPD